MSSQKPAYLFVNRDSEASTPFVLLNGTEPTRMDLELTGEGGLFDVYRLSDSGVSSPSD